jgi:hypothetical protein
MVKRVGLPRSFWHRVVIFGAVSVALLFVVGALFGSASGSDFEPVRPGQLFATYHVGLAALLTLLMLPAVLLYAAFSVFGIDPFGSDALYIAVIFLGDGILVAALCELVSRRRLRRSAAPHAHQTI